MTRYVRSRCSRLYQPRVGYLPEHTSESKKVMKWWQQYVAHSHSLQKGFISVKGVYFQASIQKHTITWLVPHAIRKMYLKKWTLGLCLPFRILYGLREVRSLQTVQGGGTWPFRPLRQTRRRNFLN